MISAKKIGEGIVTGFKHNTGAFELFIAALKNLASLRIAPTRLVLYKQVYFTGVEALNKVAIIGMLVGVVIISQVATTVGLQSALTGKILIWTVVRELGPLFCAIVIIARSCTAIASELGTMKVNREVDSLITMGIDPVAYLIVPRIVGVTLSVFILTFYFQIFAIIGGLTLSSILTDVPFVQLLNGIVSALDFFDVIISLLKTFVFGLLISTLSCYHGLRVHATITQVPQMTTIAVMQSLFMVILFDGIITLVFFL